MAFNRIYTITVKKFLNYATLNHVVCHTTLQNIELTIYQETIHLAHFKNTGKYWPHSNDFL